VSKIITEDAISALLSWLSFNIVGETSVAACHDAANNLQCFLSQRCLFCNAQGSCCVAWAEDITTQSRWYRIKSWYRLDGVVFPAVSPSNSLNAHLHTYCRSELHFLQCLAPSHKSTLFCWFYHPLNTALHTLTLLSLILWGMMLLWQ